MKKCFILLAVLVTAIVVSMVVENEDVDMPENVMAINSNSTEYSTIQD